MKQIIERIEEVILDNEKIWYESCPCCERTTTFFFKYKMFGDEYGLTEHLVAKCSTCKITWFTNGPENREDPQENPQGS